ncbi:replicative DNA helicase [Nonomuraea corallina]
MLLSKDAIADVIEIVRSDDFYRPAHQMVFDVITDLYGRGEPADAVTVFDELQKRGEMARVGGAAYLHTLTAVVPTAANAGFYAKIVREQAVLRRLIEAGTRIVSYGYGGQNEEVDDLVDRAQAEIYKVTERRTSEDYAALADIMPGALDELEAIGSRGGQMVGVPTGFADLDQLTNGLHPGQMIVVAARPAIGKALALDTPLPTPAGWTTMGEVRAGDELVGADGRPTRVVAATEVMHGRPCFEVEFSDGTVIVADADHQWRTSHEEQAPTGGAPTAARSAVVTTKELADALGRAADRRPVHSVAVAAPLRQEERRLPLPPYALGVWLGDGHRASARLTTADAGLLAALRADGVRAGRLSRPTLHAMRFADRRGSVLDVLRSLGVLGDKHIPASYLRASERQRRDLLAGLLDARGRIGASGRIELAVTGRRLARDAHELILSLGYQATSRPRQGEGREAHVIAFTTPDPVFRLTGKTSGQAVEPDPATLVRHVVAVRPVPSRPVRCVQVDNADHLYLASRSWIPTHNSTLGLDFARSAAIKHGMTTVIFSLEMSRNEITMRLLSAEARVALHAMRSGMMTDDDWTRLARRMSEVAEAPLFIDDSPNMSMMEIRAKCRRLKQRNDLRFVVIDYLQLMSSPKKTESRQNEVSEISRAIKLLAKELEVPVIAISQLNRGPEQRTDKRPQVSDLRESGCLTADTRVLRADTGAEVSLGELLESGARHIPVWSLDERLRLVPRTMTHVFPSGTKEVFRLRLKSGREVKATANHPFLTYEGWRPLGELSPGVRLAVPRGVPSPQNTKEWSPEEIVLLAHMIGDGSNVGVHGERSKQAARCVPMLECTVANTNNDTVPREVWDHVRVLLAERGVTHRRFAAALGTQFCGSALGKHAPSRARLGRVAEILDDADLELMAVNDVFWDEIASIESLGEEPVYDATVLGTHNFVANGISVHNSIEQDADMVILLHREDAYERESPRAGEADLIVAKHRNGPTATVTVAFQGHYSRFVDMAQH